jgi:K+-sensing histidine kinase KdpD
MTNCSILYDLYPLYEEGLVQPDTAAFIEQHLHECASCRQKFHIATDSLPVVVEKPKIAAAVAIKRTQSKLAIYQLIITLASFYLAMSTNMFAESLAFILTYFILGIIVFVFYRSWLLTILFALVPVLFLSFYDSAFSPGAYRIYLEQYEGGNWIGFIYIHLLGAFMMAAIHTVFAIFGGIVASLAIHVKEDSSNEKV